MKLLPRTHNIERINERERRYPFYTALDIMLQLVLSVGIFTFALGLLGIVLLNSSPQFYDQATTLARQIMS